MFINKVSLLLILNIILLSSLSAQEKYFHELKGIEDSSGVTHLFYRMYEESTFQCSESNGGHTLTSTKNHIYHLDIFSKSDSVKFEDYYSPWCLDVVADLESIIDYDFYHKNPKKWIISSSFEYSVGVSDYLENYLSFHIPIIVKQKHQKHSQDYFPRELYLSPAGDSLFLDSYGISVPFPGDSELWPEFNSYEEYINYADSLSFNLEMLAIHPAIDSLYFARDAGGNLYKSENYSGSFNLSDSNYHHEIKFDSDTLHIYSLISSGLLRSDNLGELNSWELMEIDFKYSAPRFLTVDDLLSGQLFISDSTDILFSDNHGNSFSSLFTVESEITGLYKKPDSDLLYILTKEELLELNTETMETTSLKKLPVSMEQEPIHIPKKVTLHQNYPNPFNPATVISYALKEDSHVELHIYDSIGRRGQTLVDERKTAGTHYVTFDASGYSSGVYYYQLIVPESSLHLIRKMTLIK